MSKRPLCIEDVIRFPFGVMDFQLSPDGSRVAFVEEGQIWQIGLEDNAPQFIAKGSAPRWSPDREHIAFLSEGYIWLVSVASGKPRQFNQGLKPQWILGGEGLASQVRRERRMEIWWQSINEQEIHCLTNHPDLSVLDFWVSPDGNKLAYITTEHGREKNSIVVIGCAVPSCQSLWIADIESGEVRKIFETEQTIIPITVSWSPDGGFVVFEANGNTQKPEGLYVVNIATAEKKKLLDNCPGIPTLPSWSPDNSQIAFLYSPYCALSCLYSFEVAVVSAGGGEIHQLTSGLFVYPSAPVWSPDGTCLYFQRAEGTSIGIYAVSVENRKGRRYTSFPSFQQLSSEKRYYAQGTRSFASPCLTPDGRWLITHVRDGNTLSEICLLATDGSGKRVLTHASKQLEQFELGQVSHVHWTSTDGLELRGIVVKPKDFHPEQRYPAIVYLHGGPIGGWVESDEFAEAHLFAGMGYIYFIPFRRSSGIYGWERFVEGERNPGKNFQDVLTGMDFLIDVVGADPKRCGVWGLSDGGTLVNWIITHTDRFRAAINYGGIADWSRYYFTEFEANLAQEWVLGGKLWEVPEKYRQISPMTYVAEAKTPTLFLFGEDDIHNRDAEAFYVALKEVGVPVEFVLYRGEGHGIFKPEHREDMLRRKLEWFEKYTKS